MTDILERLNQHRRSPILVDARNEIERLRAATCAGSVVPLMCRAADTMESLLARNELLEKVLAAAIEYRRHTRSFSSPEEEIDKTIAACDQTRQSAK